MLIRGDGMRYFTLLGQGKHAILLDPEGNAFEPFEIYRDRLVDSRLVSLGSLHCYLGHVARFIEYIYAASIVGIQPTQQRLDALVRSYESYLLHAQDSEDPTAAAIAHETGRVKGCNPSSLPVIEAALTHFLTLSDSLARSTGRDGLFSRYLPNTVVHVSSGEAARLRTGSMLGGAIRHGAKDKRQRGRLFLSSKRAGAKQGPLIRHRPDSEFPFECIEALINVTNNYRDKAIYALLAASGLRTHEVLQLRPNDIDFKNRRVYALDPFSRSTEGLTDTESTSLRWKCRATSETFLIQPWEDLFFEALRNYFRYEFIPGQSHPFIFQTLKGRNRGRPYFSGDRKSRIEQFRRRAKAVGVELAPGCALHSLRHSYGVYALNYLPTPQGLGMQLTVVSALMGHSNSITTRKYARHDSEIIRAELEFANRIVHDLNPKSKKELLIEHYKRKLAELTST